MADGPTETAIPNPAFDGRDGGAKTARLAGPTRRPAK